MPTRQHKYTNRSYYIAIFVILNLILGSIINIAFANSIQGLFVAHKTNSNTFIISHLDSNGSLIQQFGETSSNEFRSHLALSGGGLFRSNGVSLNTIDQFNPDGTLIRTITPNTSATHKILPISSDFVNNSIYMMDVFGGSNVIHHLDNPSTGGSSNFQSINYTGSSSIVDLDFGGSNAGQSLYALTLTHPAISSGPSRVAKLNSNGDVQFYDSNKLTLPFVTDIGSVAADPFDNVYVATTTEIVKFDPFGNEVGSFAFSNTKPSLDIDASGNLYLGQFNSSLISVFSSNGTLINSITVPNATSITDVLVVSAAVPEPSTILLLGIGLVGLTGVSVRRKLKRENE